MAEGTTVKKTKVVLGMNADPLKKEAKEAGSALKNLSQKGASYFKDMAKMAVAQVAANGVTGFFRDSMSLAIEAGETFSKFGTIFEGALGKAEVAAAGLVDDYGLSEIAAKKLLAATGDLLTGLGAQDEVALKLSETVQQVSVDIASFQNLQGGAARASEIITKAMLGERDALVSLGVKILEADVQNELLLRGQEKLTGQALLLAKANITLDSIMAQSGKAIGDYARTADSTANQLRLLANTFEDFQVKIGQNLVQNEKFQDSFQVINDLLKDPEFIHAVSDIGAMFISAFGSILPLLSGVIKGVAELSSFAIGVITDIADTIRNIPVLDEIISAYTSVAAIISGELADAEEKQIVAIQAQNDQFMTLTETLRRVRDEAGITAEVMREVSGELMGIEDPARRSQAALNALKFEELSEAMKLTDAEISKIIDDFSDIQDPARRYQKILVAISQGKYDTDAKNLSQALKNLTGEYAISKDMVSGTKQETDKFAESTETVTQLTKDQIKELKKQQEAFDKLSSSLGILAGKTLKDTNREAVNLAKIFKTNETAFSDNSDQAKLFDAKLQDLIDRFGGLNKAPEVVQQLSRDFRALNEIPEFPEMDHFEEFGEIADGLVTDILPEATIQFQETQDKVKKLNEEMERDAAKEFTEKILKLTDNIVKVGGAALDFAGKLGILGEKGREVGADLLNTFQNVGSTIAAFKSADIIGGITGIFNTLSSVGELIGDIFGGASGEMEAAERRLQGLTGVTDDWAEKIEALAQEMGGADSAGRAFNALLDDIIRSTEITTDNFDEFIVKTREIVSTFEQGNASAQETAANFGAAFTEMIKAAENLGQMGGEQITGLILLAEEFGLEVQEIAEFVESKNIAAFDSWKKAVEVFGDASIAVFDELRHEEEIMAMIPDEIKAGIEGLTGALINLSDANRLNADEVAVFEEKTLAAIAALEQQGVVGVDSILPLQDLLNRLAYLQSEYGFELDETIQKLIDEGKASGDITGDILSDGEKQIKLQERQVEVLEMIAKHFGVITDSIETMGAAASSITGGMIGDFNAAAGSLSGIADTIYDDVVPAIGQMGDTSDDVMWRNSILPDLKDWNTALGVIRGSIMNDIVTSLTEMGKTYDEIQQEIEENPLLGKLDFESIKKEFNDVFRDITDNARTGSRALSDILSSAGDIGFGIEAEAFRTENLESALESFTALKDIGEIDLGDIKHEIWKTEKELKKLREGTRAYDEVSEKLDELKRNLSDVTAAQEVFGDLSIGVLNDMYALQQKVGENPVLVEGIQAATDLLADFSKAQDMTAGEYQDFEDIVAKSFQELLGAGFTREEALKTIAPMLEQLEFLDKEFDLSIDDLTQELIDEGKKLGAVGEIQKSETEQMIDALGIMTTVLSALVESLGVELPENIMSIIDEMVGAGVDAVGEFSEKVRNVTGTDTSGLSNGDLDISDSFLFDPLFDPQVNVQGQTIPGLTGAGMGMGMGMGAAGIGGVGAADGTKTINVNMTVDINVDNPEIDTVELSRKFKTVLQDNVGGTVNVMVDAIDAAS